MRPDLYQLPRGWKFLILACLYLSQGVPFGLFVQALPVLLREGGSSLETIGLSSLLAIPWGLKFLWSPWLDRPLAGLPRRKGWLVPLQLLTIVALAALAAFDPLNGELTPLLAGILFVNLLNATQDIATDGLAVEILSPEERGLGNGLQVGGYRVGMVLGGAGALAVIDLWGWSEGLLLCAATLAVALLPLLWVRERGQLAKSTHSTQGLSTIWSFFRTRGALRVVALLVLYKFGDALAAGMLRPMLVDQDLSMTQIGTIVGGAGFVAGLVGAAVGGVIGDRLPRRSALAFGAAAQAVGGALYIPLSLTAPSVATATWIIAVEHFAGGIATVVLFTCMMDWCRPQHTGADYTVLASTVVLSTGLAAALSGYSASVLGYPGHFCVSVGLALVGGVLATLLFPESFPGNDTAADAL